MKKTLSTCQKVLIAAILLLSTLLTVTPTIGQAATQKYKVSVSNLNVRSGPSTKHKVKFSLKKNAVITKTATKGKWIKMKYGKKTGYVHSKYVKLVTTKKVTTVTKPKATATKPKATVASTKKTPVTATKPKVTTYYYVTERTGLTLRASSSATAKSLNAVIPFESKLQILQEKKNSTWIKVNYAKKTGWINGSTIYGFKSTVNMPFTATVNKQKTYLVMKANNLNVRKLPNVKSPSIGLIGKGFTAQIKRTSNNNWVEIQYSNGETGWVSANTAKSVITNKIDKVSNNMNGTLKGLTFVVDAGHGGNDPGAGGKDLNGKFITEASLALLTSKVLQKEIEAIGGKVLLTRPSTTSLSANKVKDLQLRADYAKKHNANAFISVHYNSAANQSASGYETLYYKSTSKEFANTLHENIVDAIQEEYPSYKDRKLKYQNVLVLRENSVYATLLELGFMSNPSELSRMNTTKFRSTVSEGIVNGLLEYYGRDK